jgi:hypothetical protein
MSGCGSCQMPMEGDASNRRRASGVVPAADIPPPERQSPRGTDPPPYDARDRQLTSRSVPPAPGPRIRSASSARGAGPAKAPRGRCEIGLQGIQSNSRDRRLGWQRLPEPCRQLGGPPPPEMSGGLIHGLSAGKPRVRSASERVTVVAQPGHGARERGLDNDEVHSHREIARNRQVRQG